MISKMHERIRYSASKRHLFLSGRTKKKSLKVGAVQGSVQYYRYHHPLDLTRKILPVRGSLGLLTLLKQIEFDPRKITGETRRGKIFPKTQTFPGCFWVRNRVLKVNFRVAAVTKLS